MYIPASPVIKTSYLIKKSRSNAQPPIISQLRNALLLSMGKNAFWYIIKHLKMNSGDEVLVPAYMCNGALLPFYRVGVKLRYYDIRENLGVDIKQLSNILSDRLRLLVVVHYFGFPQPVQDVIQFAEEAGIRTVEDCALSYGSFVEKQLVGTSADYGLFSIRKCLPIPDGGALLFNKNSDVPLNLDEGKITLGQSLLVLRSLLANVESITGIPFVKYLKLSRKSFIKEDLIYDNRNFNKGISSLSLKILNNLQDWESVFSKRRSNYHYLSSRVKETECVELLVKSFSDGACPMNFPLLVKDRDKVMKKLKKMDVPCFIWPDLPSDIEKSLKKYPVTEYLVNNILLLPVHQDLTRKQLDYISEKISLCCH